MADPETPLERMDGIIRYVESWVDVKERDPFLDDLRIVRDALRASEPPHAALKRALLDSGRWVGGEVAADDWLDAALAASKEE